MSSKLRMWGKFLVDAAKAQGVAMVRYLYWKTDASTTDPLLKQGLKRAWTEGVNEGTASLPPRVKPASTTKPN